LKGRIGTNDEVNLPTCVLVSSDFLIVILPYKEDRLERFDESVDDKTDRTS